MKILFISTEFEEQARGITGIIKAMVNAAKEDDHEVGVLVGYPYSDQGNHQLLDKKVEHLYLQHYLTTGKKNLYPNLHSRRAQLKIMATREYDKSKQMRIDHSLITQPSNLANKLDYIIKIPYVYRFINHGLGQISKRALKKAIKKYKIDLVITGAPMDITKQDVAPAKLAQFIHDTMPIELLETPADNQTPQRFAREFFAATNQSDLVLVNSRDTEEKVKEINPHANVHVLYGTASSKASQFHDISYLERKQLQKDKFLLFISVIERRKNIDTLLDAYMHAYSKIKMPLVIVGGKGFGYKEIMAHYKDLPIDIQSQIIFTGFISEADKYALLNNARAFVFPSLYEGIGLPIIEAFSSGLPVLTSNKGALPEAGGNAALYIDNPYDVNELSEAMVRISNDEFLRKDLKSHIDTQVNHFTPDKFNDRFSQAIKGLAR